MEWVEQPSQNITQGSIISEDKGLLPTPLSIVLSNACDLEHDKCGFLIMAGMVPAKETISNSKEFQSIVQGAKDNMISKNQWKSLSNFLGGYIHNKNICRYYLIDLAPVINIEPLLVDFQWITSIPYDMLSQIDNVAKLKSPFVEQMMMKFVSYTARIPSDRVEQKQEEKILSLLANGYTPKE